MRSLPERPTRSFQMSPKAFAKTVVFAATFSAGLAGAAFARDAVFTARLAQPAQQTRFIADNAVWNCEADTCVARLGHSASVRTCRQFVREAGIAVTAYGPAEAQLSAAELARCNARIASQTQQARN